MVTLMPHLVSTVMVVESGLEDMVNSFIFYPNEGKEEEQH